MEKGIVKEAPSLSGPVEADNSVKTDYSAQEVADAFLKQYYYILQTNPKEAHKFYHDHSIRAHPSADGSMKSVTTMKDIDDEIMGSNVKEWNPDLSTVHAQDSIMQSVIVGVIGCLTDNDNVTKKFAQTFLLAIQEGGGFYVHNDFLHFIDVGAILETSPLIDDAAADLNIVEVNDTDKDSFPELPAGPKKDQNEKPTSEEEDGIIENKVSDSSKCKAASKKKSHRQPSVWVPAKNMQEVSNKISYASIVAKEVTVASSDAVVVTKTSVVLGVPKASVKPSPFATNDPRENLDIKSIRVKDLPPKMTPESLLEHVKKFGPVKQKNIQIKEYSQDGYRYAFVEFDNPKSARSAVEARYIKFEDRTSEIQYKRSSNQGHHIGGKPQFGHGGVRNDSFWSRDGEGRSSGSWGHRYNEHEKIGQNRDLNNNRRNRNIQEPVRSFT
ncbi:nuclear transport factor 2-like [Rutidosis leptorrhynchoides]|uniref:nuclear transport factor 2-like n=1 Tax=Rutidosis leptorrhynchoides TaxID=125765 RepID=UPI003A99CE93